MKCLIADKMHPCIIDILNNGGCDVDYQPDFTREEIGRVLPVYDILILRSKTFVDEELISGCKKLKVIGRAGAGVDNIDLESMERNGIRVLNAGEGNRDAVGDHTVGMMLALLNHFVKSFDEIRKLVWDREGNRGQELSEMTVALIGYGNTGQAVAKRLSGFGCRVLCYDKYRENYGDDWAEETDWNYIYREADMISFHVPLTYETKRMINQEFLSHFEKKIYVINNSRGEILDHEHVIQGLESGKIRGLGLDVLENEKFSTLTVIQEERLVKLLKSNRVLLTPHVAGWSFESYRKISEVLGHKILEHI